MFSINEIRKEKGLPPLEDEPVYTFDGIFSKLKNRQSDYEPQITEDADFEIIEPKRIENKK